MLTVKFSKFMECAFSSLIKKEIVDFLEKNIENEHYYFQHHVYDENEDLKEVVLPKEFYVTYNGYRDEIEVLPIFNNKEIDGNFVEVGIGSFKDFVVDEDGWDVSYDD